MKYETPKENRAYMDGYVKGQQDDGFDWVRGKLELQALEEKVKAIIAKKDRELSKLRGIIHERDMKILDLESQIEAHKIAWRHRHEEA